MPFVVQKTDQCPASKPFGVLTETSHGSGKTTGKPHGCFASKTAAKAQQRALYANVPEAKSEIDPGLPEVPPMTATASPVLTPNTVEWRRERALALSGSQRKRPETRQIHEPLELREASEDGKRTLRSYASLFNDSYSIRAAGYKFDEVIRPGAFKRTLGTNPDVVFRTEHSGPPLAATWSGDLRLGEDTKGLWYEVTLDESDPDVQSLISKVNRGVYRESSFAFRIPKDGDRWNEAHDRREVLACELDRGDVSVVTFGASRATGKHMLLRSEEEAIQALQEMGFERFLQVFVEWRDFTLLPPEERIGKVISSQSMESLRQVLGLIADADDAVDEAEAMLSDFLGVPNPDDEEGSGASSGGKVTESEQLDHTGRSEEEERDDPSYEDYDIAYGLKNVKLAIASVKACQLCDPGNETDSDDKAVMAALDKLDADVDAAIVAQAQDGRREDGDRAEQPDLWKRVGDLALEVGWEVSLVAREDGSPGFEIRKALSTKARNDLPDSAFVFPKDRSYPIQDVSHARNALARASGKPEEAAVKKAVYKRYPALKPTSDRAEVVLLAENDTEDLQYDFRLRSAR